MTTGLNVTRQIKKTAKDEARKVARQIASEPFEIIREASRKSVGVEIFPDSEQQKKDPDSKQVDKSKEENIKKEDEAKKIRLHAAYIRELEDIKKEKKLSELQEKIQLGEDITQADLEGLSIDERQVIVAQIEVMQTRKAAQKAKDDNRLVIPQSKPKRGAFSGRIKKMEKRLETRTSGSG